jgi:hypothetical protein
VAEADLGKFDQWKLKLLQPVLRQTLNLVNLPLNLMGLERIPSSHFLPHHRGDRGQPTRKLKIQEMMIRGQEILEATQALQIREQTRGLQGQAMEASAIQEPTLRRWAV